MKIGYPNTMNKPADLTIEVGSIGKISPLKQRKVLPDPKTTKMSIARRMKKEGEITGEEFQTYKKQYNIFNVACGHKISLNQLAKFIIEDFEDRNIPYSGKINYLPPRKGDIQDSLADISKAKSLLGYFPDINFKDSLKKTISWYLKDV